MTLIKSISEYKKHRGKSKCFDSPTMLTIRKFTFPIIFLKNENVTNALF